MQVHAGIRSWTERRGKEGRWCDGPKGPPLHGLWWLCSGQSLDVFVLFPWCRPGRWASGALHPLNCLRARKSKFLGSGTQLFAYGIPPYIAGDVLNSVGGAQDVLVVAHFPEG